MRAPSVDLFDWLHENAPKATCNLAYSNIQGLTAEEYRHLTRYTIPAAFDLGINASAGAKELMEVLEEIYQCTKDAIVTTTGASEANYLVFSSLLGPGDEFIVEQPGYQPMWLTPEMLGARRVELPRVFEHRYRVDIEALEGLITDKTKLIILTNLHNPSGVWSAPKSVESISEIAQEHGLYVLIDEIFLDGCFTPPASSFGLPRVIVTSSTTKIYGLGGLHTGWIVAPEEVAVECQRRKSHTSGASSYVSEVMTAHALMSSRDALIARFRDRAKENFLIVKQWIQTQKDVMEWVEPDGGIVCFPRYHLEIPSVSLCQRALKEAGVLLNPGSYFNEEGHFRLSYGIDPKMLQQGLQALGGTFAQLKK